MEETYLVSGYMRTGTSMMMKALDHSGLNAVYNEDRDEVIEERGDEHYQPNPALFELGKREYQHPAFPRMFEGRLVKCLMGGIDSIPSGKYKIVFMRRDFEEIRQSYNAFFNTDPSFSNRKPFRSITAKKIGILRQRRDVDLSLLWYRDVVQDPLPHFEYLHSQGWPIDPQKAADVPDPDHIHFKEEELIEGI